jgi:hypothetical protein
VRRTKAPAAGPLSDAAIGAVRANVACRSGIHHCGMTGRVSPSTLSVAKSKSYWRASENCCEETFSPARSSSSAIQESARSAPGEP